MGWLALRDNAPASTLVRCPPREGLAPSAPPMTGLASARGAPDRRDVRRPAYVLLVRPPATVRARADLLLGGKEHHRDIGDPGIAPLFLAELEAILAGKTEVEQD